VDVNGNRRLGMNSISFRLGLYARKAIHSIFNLRLSERIRVLSLQFSDSFRFNGMFQKYFPFFIQYLFLFETLRILRTLAVWSLYTVNLKGFILLFYPSISTWLTKRELRITLCRSHTGQDPQRDGNTSFP